MAVATTTAPAVTEDKELLISGSEAVAEALALADLDVVTAYPIRPYDTGRDLGGSALAGSVLADERMNGRRGEIQIERVDRDRRSIRLRDVTEAEQDLRRSLGSGT